MGEKAVVNFLVSSLSCEREEGPFVFVLHF